MSYEFIKDLTESRLFRTEYRFPEYSTSEISDMFFYSILALHITSEISDKVARKYASDTLTSGSRTWRTSSSDLHNLAHVIENQDDFSDKISTDKYITIPRLQFNQYLRNIINDKNDTEYTRRFILRIQKDLGITNPLLKTLRRTVCDWDKASDNEKEIAATKIYRFLKSKMFNSDIYLMYSKAIEKKGLLSN